MLTECRDLVTARSRVTAHTRRRRNPRSTGRSRGAPVSSIELVLDLRCGRRLGRSLFDLLAALFHSLAQVTKRIEPRLVTLARGSSKFDGTTRGCNNQALLVETRRHGIEIFNLFDRLNRHTLGLELYLPGCLWIPIAPVQCPCVRMDPEESTVTCVRHATAHCLAGVLPEVLADHCLGDGLDHTRISGTRRDSRWRERWSTCNIKALVDLRCERGDRRAAADRR